MLSLISNAVFMIIIMDGAARWNCMLTFIIASKLVAPMVEGKIHRELYTVIILSQWKANKTSMYFHFDEKNENM